VTALTAPEFDSHMALGLAESAACAPTAWERWIDQVEKLLGHDTDGDQEQDGYSLDGFYASWKAGLSPAQAVETVDETAARLDDERFGVDAEWADIAEAARTDEECYGPNPR
jgi:hypothetical protein